MDAPAFPMTPEGFKATHMHLFQDVFPWAGQVRMVGLTHPRHNDPFAFPHLIEGALAKQFRWLATEGDLAGLDATAFAAKAAHHAGELNAIHGFREGNGRTMRLHLQQLATQAGHQLDGTRLPAQAWNDASNISFHTGDSRPLAAVIEHGMNLSPTPRPEQAVSSLSPDGRLFYAVVAEKIERQMTKLTPEAKAKLRELVARGLVGKEEREGPVVLSSEQRRLATTLEPPPERREQATPAPPEPSGPGKRRR